MLTLTAYDLTITAEDLNIDADVDEAICANPALLYLITNGYRQSIGDAGAVQEKDIPLGVSKEEFIAGKRQARRQAIIDGKVGLGADRGPRLQGLEAIEFELVVDNVLKPLFRNAKKPWPSGKGSAEEIRNRVKEYWSKPHKSQDILRAQAKELFAAQTNPDVLEVAELVELLS